MISAGQKLFLLQTERQHPEKKKPGGGHFQLKETKQTQQELHCIPNQRKKQPPVTLVGRLGKCAHGESTACQPCIHVFWV